MATTQYIGARYVPIFGRLGEDSIQWDNTATYEPLTVVLHQGNSYTSRQFVPVGIEITNQDYWAETGNYNAQIEQYRQDVQGMQQGIDDNTAAIVAEADRAKEAESANAAAIAAESERAKEAESANAAAIESVNGKLGESFVCKTIRKDNNTYTIFKMKRNKHHLKLSLTNSQNVSCTASVDDYARKLNSASTDVLMFSCDRFDTTSLQAYNCRVNGIGYTGAGVSDSESNAYYLAFSNDGTEIATFPRGTAVEQIPSKYENVFVTGFDLIKDGESKAASIPSDYATQYQPTQAFAWNEEWFCLLTCYGRNLFNIGMQRTEAASILLAEGMTNATDIDGGGSLQQAVNFSGNSSVINGWPNVNRNVPLIMSVCKNDDYSVNYSSLLNISSYTNSYKTTPITASWGFQDKSVTIPASGGSFKNLIETINTASNRPNIATYSSSIQTNKDNFPILVSSGKLEDDALIRYNSTTPDIKPNIKTMVLVTANITISPKNSTSSNPSLSISRIASDGSIVDLFSSIQVYTDHTNRLIMSTSAVVPLDSTSISKIYIGLRNGVEVTLNNLAVTATVFPASYI